MVAVLGFVATARADDTVKLNLKSTDSVQTKNLLGDGGADTVNVHRWYGGRYYARPFYGHYHHARYWYPRAYWGWRGFYPGVGVYVGSPYYYGAACYDYGVAAAPAVYSAPPVVIAPSGISLRVPFVSLNISRAPRIAAPAPTETLLPAPRPMPKEGGTYQYDGGPANPVPMPPADPAPSRLRPAPVVPEGRTVSLQAAAPKYQYAAYGEKSGQPVKVDSQLAAKTKK
jgi:hypothetical protein